MMEPSLSDAIGVFDACAEEYDRWFDENPLAFQSELNAVRSLIPPNSVGVEIGAGTGRFAVPLGIHTGVEPAEGMARIAGRRGITVYASVAESLPFQDASFDFALFINGICFMEDPSPALGEIRRILKPRGCLILAAIDRETDLGRGYEAMKHTNKFYAYARFRSASDIRALLVAAGFVVESVAQTIFGNPFAMTVPDPVEKGSGRGGFVAFKAVRPD